MGEFLTPGDRVPGIPASGWNYAQRGADIAHRLARSQSAGNGSGSQVTVPAKNISSTNTIDRFDIVFVKNILVTPSDNANEFKNNFVLEVEGDLTNPTFTWRSRVGIAQETIGPLKIGRVMLLGVSPLQITINDADHRRARIDSSSGAQSAPVGPIEILYMSAYSGTAWCLVRLTEDPAPHALEALSDESGSNISLGSIQKDGTRETDNIAVATGGIIDPIRDGELCILLRGSRGNPVPVPIVGRYEDPLDLDSGGSSTSWDRSSPPSGGENGCKFQIITHLGAGTPTSPGTVVLEYKYRVVTVDSRGAIADVTTETSGSITMSVGT